MSRKHFRDYNKIKSFGKNWLWAERKWSKISDDTCVGDQRSATVVKSSILLHSKFVPDLPGSHRLIQVNTKC